MSARSLTPRATYGIERVLERRARRAGGHIRGALLEELAGAVLDYGFQLGACDGLGGCLAGETGKVVREGDEVGGADAGEAQGDNEIGDSWEMHDDVCKVSTLFSARGWMPPGCVGMGRRVAHLLSPVAGGGGSSRRPCERHVTLWDRGSSCCNALYLKQPTARCSCCF